MKKLKILLLLLAFVSILSCKKNDSSHDDNSEESGLYSEDETTDKYPDGTYCANVEYYNPNTGTQNTYTLNVEVENNEVTLIHWPNGGWLDEDHFIPEELDSDGSCSFTSDKGYEYTIQINGPECSFTDESKLQSDVNEDNKAVTCSECGGEKSEYDDYCYFCERKFKCPECYGKKGKYDDLCWYCQRKVEDKKREEEENNE